MNKLFVKMAAAQKIAEQVEKIESEARTAYVQRQIDDNGGTTEGLTVISFDTETSCDEMLDDVKKEELAALRKAANKLAYSALAYLFSHTNKNFKLAKPMPMREGDVLVFDDNEIFLIDSNKYDIEYSFEKSKIIIIDKETKEEVDYILSTMFSLKHDRFEHLFAIYEEVKYTLWKDEYKEVRCDYYDDIMCHWCVDAWRSDDDNEEGKTVATIDDHYNVNYIYEEAKYCDLVKEVIEEEIAEIKKMKRGK